MKIAIGDRVRFDTHSNLGVREDIVRGLFTYETILEPYARNERGPALTLTAHSWCRESDVIEVIKPV
jgi:hypothetical protein